MTALFLHLALLPLALTMPQPPAADTPLPRTDAGLAQELQRVDQGLRRTISSWDAADPGLRTTLAPEPVQLWALRQQRILLSLRSRPTAAADVIRQLPGSQRADVAQTLAAMADLKRLAPRHPPKHHRLRVGLPLPPGRLLDLYRSAQQRFHVAWNVLAAVNFVETGFNKLQNDSVAGAQGPMQFMPSTWRRYGLGGDIHKPRDAILGAANYLRASGAPASYGRALYSYNPSRLYVDAVLRYARRIGGSRWSFLSYYSWQIFSRNRAGELVRLTGPR